MKVPLLSIHVARGSRNIAGVKLLLADERVDVNSKDNAHQVTPLIQAAKHVVDIGIFKLLLAQQRVDVNWVASYPVSGDVTALMKASWHSNVEATKLLLDDPRVDVNWMDSRGLTVLHRLVASPKPKVKKNLQMLQLLLAHPRVDVNCKGGPLGANILDPAAFYNEAEVVKLILAEPRFTSANTPDEMGRTAVNAAMLEGNWDVLRELVHHPSVDLGVNLDDLAR